MTDKRLFHLKPFSLSHHRSTMKVGMDSLILGNWVNPEHKRSILDVGTGCGILALIMAYRSHAVIDAIELDQASAAEARENFRFSPFHRRLHVIDGDFKSYAARTTTKYDLIISNPPYFINDQKSVQRQKRMARHGESLSYHQLIAGCLELLNRKGSLCLVLPYAESQHFMKVATSRGLHLVKQMLIFPRRGHPPNRINLELAFQHPDRIVTELFIVREENNQFSSQYTEFLKNLMIGKIK